MLQTIREKTKGWIASIILGFICFTFALWGIHYYLNQSPTEVSVAKVNGQSISRAAFEKQLRQLAQENNMESFTAKQKKMVLTQMINQKIWQIGLEKAGFNIPQALLMAFLSEVPLFQSQGKFSPQRFQNWLAYQGAPEGQVLHKIKMDIAFQQLASGLSNSEFVLPQELAKAAAEHYTTMDIAYFIVTPEALGSQAMPSEKAMADYYQSHQNAFMQPPRVKVHYLLLDRGELAKIQTISPKAIQQYYDAHKAQFQTASNQALPLSAARPMITKRLQDKKAEKLFASDSDKLVDLVYEHPNSLAPAASALGLKIQESDFFDKNTLGTGIAENVAVRRAAFSPDVYQAGYNSNVLTLNSGKKVVLRVFKKQAAQAKSFETVKGQVEKILQQEAAETALHTLLNQTALSLKQGIAPNILAKKLHTTTQRLLITQQDAGNKVPSAIVQAVFANPHLEYFPHVLQISLGKDKYALLIIYDKKPGELSKLSPAQKAALNQLLIHKMAGKDLDTIFMGLKRQAKIKFYT